MGKIKNLTKIFNKYQNPLRSLNHRFIYHDLKSNAFLNKYSVYCDRSLEQDYLHPIDTFRVLTTTYDTTTDYINTFINYFTCHNDCNDNALQHIEETILKRSNKIESFDYEDRDHCTIRLKNGRKIYFQTITSSFDNILEDIPDLLSHDRDHKCHTRSLALVNIIAQDCSCVTEIIYPLTPKAKWLHSWVEIDLNGKTYCMDNNKNAVLLKDDYYYLMHAKPMERITQSTIINELDMIKYFNDHTSRETPYIKLYCACHDEAVAKYKKIIGSQKDSQPDIEK